MNNENNNFKDELLHKIQCGEIKMRPKAFFVAKVAILIFISVITFIVSVLLVSYTWFVLSASGKLFLLSFGSRGMYEFLLLFPWFLLLIVVGLILALDWLIKRFRFGYHNPALIVFGGSLVVITIFGAVVNMTSFHRNMMRMAEQKNLPIPMVPAFYSEIRKTYKDKGVFRGEVVSIATSSFHIKNSKYDSGGDIDGVEVSVPEGFDVRYILRIGDEVFIAGDFASGSIRAYGVKKLTFED